jgi:protein-S-isoprenylcysteine O-methyltransferase Ste14
MSIFEMAYWMGILIEMAIRAPLQKTWKEIKKVDQRVSRTERILLGLLWVVMIVLPLAYSATNWLEFANYTLPAWMGWVGIFILICALLVFTRAHIDLKSNWSPTLEIFK